MAKHNFCTDALEELKRERQKITIELHSAKGVKERISLLEKRGELSREIKALEVLSRGIWAPGNYIETATADKAHAMPVKE